jgi:hypothetical protein
MTMSRIHSLFPFVLCGLCFSSLVLSAFPAAEAGGGFRCLIQDSQTLDSPELSEPPASGEGKLIAAENIGVWDQDKLKRIVNAELSEFLQGASIPFEQYQGKFAEPKFRVQLYKLTFRSMVPEQGNQEIRSTGLVAIPETDQLALPLLSYQHGTVFGKFQIPSETDNSMETKLLLTQFASQGYIVIAADYFGLGNSDLPNSYIQQASTEQACLDLRLAALEFLEKQARKQVSAFFTLGWSQGGYNNMIFLRRLEQAGIPVTASATASAPVDLTFFVARVISNPRPFDAVYSPACISNLLFAFEEYHKIPGLAASAIRPEYYQAARDFYDFKLEWPDYLQQTTGSSPDLLQPEFMEQINLGSASILPLLGKSQAYRWVSRTPLRAYTGGRDEAVPDYLARLAVDYQALLGKKNGEALSAGEQADHRNTYVHSVIDLKPWFDSFLNR